MFARQRWYREVIGEHGFPLPASYDDHAAAWEDVRRVLTTTAGPTVPCNNDLLAGNFIDDGERVWLIDYDYSGNNDPCFELGNTSTECEFDPDLTAAWTRGVLRARRPAPAGEGAAPGPVQRVRLVAVGLHPGRVERARLRLPRLGHASLREGRPHLHLACSTVPTGSVAAVVEEVALRPSRHHRARRAGVESRGRASSANGRPAVAEFPPAPRSWSSAGEWWAARSAYHLTKLGLDRRAPARAGHLSGGTTWHAAGLVGPAAGDRVRHPPRAVLRRALRLARGRDRLRHRLPQRGRPVVVARTPERMAQLRRTAANAVAYDLDCQMLTPGEAQELWPPMAVDDLLGAIWLPGRRKGQPGRPHPVAGARCAAAGARGRRAAYG